MLHGKSRIGNSLSKSINESFEAINPSSNAVLDGLFYNASTDEVNQAMELAMNAFDSYKQVSALKRADFLEAIADEMLNLGEVLVKRASLETGLPEARIIGERGRTMMQLKLFAELLRDGSWVEASIDEGDDKREPLPKPDLRKMLHPIGPVVVFTASNFPLAYSTAGGDTASALAAGNPVIVKSHPSHPGTNEMVTEAILSAAQKTGMPNGVFSSLNSNSFTVGTQLVKHPNTMAVGFTGSFQGGTALWKAANEREVPIPVFSEMGSTNPVYFLSDILHTSATELAKTMSGSITLGSGQFCTNPGLMVGIKSDALTQFANELQNLIEQALPSVMLSKGISTNYYSKMNALLQQKGVSLLASAKASKTSDNDGVPGVATVDFEVFKQNPQLHEEIFGPFSLLVQCNNRDELLEFACLQMGQLTSSIFGSDSDFNAYANVVEQVKKKAGRLVFNGVPTGVEVNTSMHHGGPFPATTDSRFTSVGPDAIKRFVRPIAYQNAPQSMLPPELKDGNPLGIWRKVNGKLTKD